jgi:YebC/PmpR family DNA-binding regulatory protein
VAVEISRPPLQYAKISGHFIRVFRGVFTMSGHSKWHTIKHKKGAADAKRGKVFTRIIKELTVAARNGGGDVDTNPRLRTIVAEAKSVNMPADNIKRAIQRGTGELPGVSYEEITYEGYGPGGAAVIVETLTDNKNRTVGEIRHILSKHSGNLAAENSVAWMFDKKGYIVVEKAKAEEEALMAAALDAGADDMRDDGDSWEVVSAPESFQKVLDAVKALGIEPGAAEVAMLPQNYVKLEGKAAQQMIKLMEALEDHEDTKKVWSNADIEEKEIEASLA